MIKCDLGIVEEKLGYRIDLPDKNGAWNRSIFVFKDEKIDTYPHLVEETGAVSFLAYRKVGGSWLPCYAGDIFEAGSLEHTAFETMQIYVNKLRRTA